VMSETTYPTIEEFLLARLEDAERKIEGLRMETSRWTSLMCLIENQRDVIEWHKNWPIMVETPPKFEKIEPYTDDPAYSMKYQMTQQIAWVTQEEYRKRFGSEPPTAPLLAKMAARYSDHPDYNPDWRIE
jgi:hypothetical protein